MKSNFNFVSILTRADFGWQSGRSRRVPKPAYHCSSKRGILVPWSPVTFQVLPQTSLQEDPKGHVDHWSLDYCRLFRMNIVDTLPTSPMYSIWKSEIPQHNWKTPIAEVMLQSSWWWMSTMKIKPVSVFCILSLIPFPKVEPHYNTSVGEFVEGVLRFFTSKDLNLIYHWRKQFCAPLVRCGDGSSILRVFDGSGSFGYQMFPVLVSRYEAQIRVKDFGCLPRFPNRD